MPSELTMYHQDTDYSLLLAALARLADRVVIDVGAERGSFVQACLDAGSPHVYACEPYPPHADTLRTRFAGEPRVTRLECAIGARDETATLHIAHDRDGKAYDYHHSLVPSPDSSEVRWDTSVTVPCRTLRSMVEDGTLPPRVGILKIDTEGGDLGVLQGLGTLHASVVMVEYWEGLPDSIGDSPYRIGDLVAELGPRGYREFLFVKRHDELEIAQWTSAHTRAGDWGNLVFVHESAMDELRPVLTAQAARVYERLVDQALAFRAECDKRLEMLNESQARATALDEECAKRLDAMQALQARIDALESGAPGNAAPVQTPAWIGPAPDGEAERLRSGRPRVSIITPSFNHAQFLDETIRSVLGQHYADLEYIVIDGGSKDGSVEIIERYADRIAYWVSEADDGQADALNKGFARATGDIVAWLNSDDVLFPGAIDAAVAAFAANPGLGLVYGRGHRIDEHGNLIGEFSETRAFDQHALEHGVDYILQPTTFMRHQALHEAGPLNRDLHYAFDWDLWLRLGKRYPAMMLDRVLAASREYAATKTSSGGFRRTEEIRQMVNQHTGGELSVGYLNYLMNAILDALPASKLPDTARLSRAVAGVSTVCHELLRQERFLEQGPATRPPGGEVGPHADGWAGPELRWQMAVPPDARYLCVRGEHDGGIARVAGALSLHAAVDGQPLGLAIVDTPGPFTMAWRLPPAAAGDSAALAPGRRHVAISSATSFVPSRFHETTDHRALAFRFTSCTLEVDLPAGAATADQQLQDVLAEVRQRHLSVSQVVAAFTPQEARAASVWGTRFARRVAGGLRRRARRWWPFSRRPSGAR